MAHSLPLVHSMLLLYLLFLCTLCLRRAIVNQEVPFRDSREDCPQHLDIQRQCDSGSFQSLRMLVAGKYESAWQTLVDRSHDGQISAAVVFLPKGQRFSKFRTAWCYPLLRVFVGDCWCFPLYGEQKPWGCRWWTLWAANIEKAVRCGVELQVFFFENMKGQGKVQSFATAGAEHCQRERIWQKNEEFKESVAYREAVAAGLDSLSKDAGEDSSSQHSRELQRLFWAWLPKEDREFLAASEGLGNSQKAEVAWLERKGYQYTQVDIIECSRSSGVQDVPWGSSP